MTRALRTTTLVLALTALLPAAALAQSVGTISGTVMDSSKGALPGAVVTARNEGTSAVREVVADANGHYTIPLLPIGSYTITATMSGFQTQEVNKVVLEVQASLTLDFTLDIAGLTSEVTVVGQAGMVQIQRSDANLGQLINAQQVAELPLNGCDVARFLNQMSPHCVPS